MDFSRFTSAQLHIMHESASNDARTAINLAESRAIEMSEAANRFDDAGYATAHAEFAALMAQADDHRAYSRQVYNEIARRVNMPAMPVLPDVPAPLNETAVHTLTHVPMVCTACRKPVHESIAAEGWVHDLRADSRGCNTPAVKAMVAEGNERVPGLPVLPARTAPLAGGRTASDARYCRSCGFTDCEGATSGDCPRWPARETVSETPRRHADDYGDDDA